MKLVTALKIIFILSLGGLLFAGYLSGIKLVSGSCAFNDPCPYFLGYPACWYGFGMYLFMLVFSGLGLLGKMKVPSVFKAVSIISFIGILFAGRFALQELVYGEFTGTLGLSTCVYVLIFYILIFSVSFRSFRLVRR